MEPYHGAKPTSPGTRASDAERDAVVQRLQVAFAEGRLTDQEFDDRMRAALAARLHADLDELLTDLPLATAPVAPRPVAPAAGPRPGRYAIAYKNTVRQTGRWRVPGAFRVIVYKGTGLIDLRAAELTEGVTRLAVVAYKSDVEVVVPPGIRVEVSGVGTTRDDDWAGDLPSDAPVVHVRGLAYKGRVDTVTRPSR
jgi:Domain of unknown function (DUF1707)